METRLVAVLEIGSTGIRLLVAEISPCGEWKVVDRSEKPVALGRDVFTSGGVSRESLLECLSVLKNFRELLDGWSIRSGDIYLIGTSALRAARNRDIFEDRVRHETGFRLSIVEGIEENRLMYLAVRFALKQDLPLFWRANSMIIEIGGGSTEVMLLRRGKMVAAHSLALGTILIDQQSRLGPASGRFQERYLNENIRTTAGFLSAELDLSHIRTFVVAGSDARLVSDLAGSELNENCRIIDRESFTGFAERIQHYTVDECVRNLNISYPHAEGLIPSIRIYKLFLEQTPAVQVVVPLVSIREGFLIDLVMGVDSEPEEDFYSQIIASAMNLGRRYHYDEAHGRHVADLCLVFFDSLVRQHGMGRPERRMLEIAAILHDIGMYINGAGHHRHGYYIVANSEIFGIRRNELNMIAVVIRYHRGDPPVREDDEYAALPRKERILVLKMASILRVADALDRGHAQRVKKINLEQKAQAMLIHTEGVHDLSLEQIGIEQKADLFQDVFGYKIILD
ncbi:MAG: HD domain-containing protein [Treponema sp.]|jgi:exopolyphosphatase/guanosine-5'-triphosphate,3'-diphosphate pyrophosphatase|nr:HD domain-containing protein [Treponema sp.]